MKLQKSFQFDVVQGFKFGSYPIGKPKMFVHVYFVDGLLIDTGHSNMRREVMKTIGELPVEQVYITHHHEDHTGNLEQAQNHFKCPTYASSICAEMMKKPPRISFAQWLTWGNRPANYQLIPNDNKISTPNFNFEIIPIPGHAKDMVGLYEKNQGWFFSSDLYVYDYVKYFMRPESVIQQIESIRRVLKLDFDVLFCGHNPKFKNGKKGLQRKLVFFEDFYEQVSKLHNQGNSVNVIIKKMKLKRNWAVWALSMGALSTSNMVRAVIRDEQSN